MVIKQAKQVEAEVRFLPSVEMTKMAMSFEQLRLLETDNICDTDAVERHFWFEPVRYKEALKLFVKQANEYMSERVDGYMGCYSFTHSPIHYLTTRTEHLE